VAVGGPTLAQLIDPRTREGTLWEPLAGGRLRCVACGHRCVIPPGQRGVCKVRYNREGRLRVPWGYVAGLQLDPIEKKPFFHAYPGARALSLGMLGCDLHCAYCFTGDTPVVTRTGVLPIAAIFDGATERVTESESEARRPRDVIVMTALGTPRPVAQAFRHSYRGELRIVRPMYLPPIRCTPGHRWLATTDPTGADVREVTAADLAPCHWLLVPKAVGVCLPVPLGAAGLVKATDSQYLVPVEAAETEVFDGFVYNLEVEAEHSYLAGFCAVKNCQNALTSQALRDPAMGVPPEDVAPADVVAAARRMGARVLTSTYNEPLITAEWGVEIFRAGKTAGLVGSFVSNGNATPEVLDYLRPWVELYKVDLKAFRDRSYRQLGGLLETILASIRGIHARGFWLEIVTLIVPRLNDDEGELREAAEFIAGVSPDIPWHVTAFHPDYRMGDRDGTPARTLIRAAELGVAAGLRYVYAGNLPGRVGPFEDTRCPGCGKAVVRRMGFHVLERRVDPSGRCEGCGTAIAGRWD
jgi:pyruvate formate lyase activating enzyme